MHTLETLANRYPYTIVRSKRKTVALVVTSAAELLVRAPVSVPEWRITDFIARKAEWVEKQMRRFAGRAAAKPPLQYVAGESHYLLGKQYVLDVVCAERDGVEVGDECITVRKKAARFADAAHTKRVYTAWLLKQAQALFHERYHLLAPQFGYVSLPRLTMRSMKTRWGSYRSSGSIALNTKLIHAPLASIDYVIAHELCHHTHPNHGTGFYALLSETFPTWKEERQRLKESGKVMCG